MIILLFYSSVQKVIRKYAYRASELTARDLRPIRTTRT